MSRVYAGYLSGKFENMVKVDTQTFPWISIQLLDSECSKVSRILLVKFLDNFAEDNFTPLSPGIGATPGKIYIKANLNAAASRIFDPENCLKA